MASPTPHPYIHTPILYMLNLPTSVSDVDLATLFESCRPFKPTVPRNPEVEGVGYVNATVEFKVIESAEKALAILQNQPIPSQHEGTYLTLTPFLPTPTNPSPLPPTPAPNTKARIIKHLPYAYTPSQLFDLFRPYGPIFSSRILPPNSNDNEDSTGLITFYKEEHAKQAEQEMHCAEVADRNIAVTVYNPSSTTSTSNLTTNPKRAFHSDISPNAPPFIPSGINVNPYTPQHTYPTIYQSQSQPQPPAITPILPRTSPPTATPFMHGPGQQVQFAPLHGPGSTSHSGLIDPCNLFCKNLDPDIDSNALFTHFRPFGQIVSARVMRTDSGQSRGFGFVSFQTPDQAASALNAMNGIILGSKQLVVRLHEPKQLRQEKLAQRFASSNSGASPSSSSPPSLSSPSHAHMQYLNLKSRSGATSPDMSILGSEDGYASGYSPGPALGLSNPNTNTNNPSSPGFVPATWSPASRYGSLGNQSQIPSPRVGMGGLGDIMSNNNNTAATGTGTGPDRPRRTSGSYYHAALSGHLNIPLTYEDLSALSPVVRKEVLLGEMTRRVRSIDADAVNLHSNSNSSSDKETKKKKLDTDTPEVDAIIDKLVSMDLEDVISTLTDSTGDILIKRVRGALGANVNTTEGETEIDAETEKRLLTASASAPEHPSTPISLSGSMVISTPARTESPSSVNVNPLPTTSSTSTSSLTPSQNQSQSQSEQTRLHTSILALEPDPVLAAQITELIMGLGKKERAMCLFNREYLRGKVGDARLVLESGAEEEGVGVSVGAGASTGGGNNNNNTIISSSGDIGKTDSSPASTSTKQSETPPTTQIHTLQTLAPLPPSQIYTYLTNLSTTSPHLLPSPLVPPDALITQSTNDLINSFHAKSLTVPQMKQQLGDRLFRIVKAWGIKGAPKVTIMLLDEDGDDLRALAHLMNCFPEVLKVKAGLFLEKSQSQSQGAGQSTAVKK